MIGRYLMLGAITAAFGAVVWFVDPFLLMIFGVASLVWIGDSPFPATSSFSSAKSPPPRSIRRELPHRSRIIVGRTVLTQRASTSFPPSRRFRAFFAVHTATAQMAAATRFALDSLAA
jgi:hypothetical protein